MYRLLIKKSIKKLLKRFGIRISKIGIENSLVNEFSMEGALYRCKIRGLQVNTVIDVGASDGRWTRMCLNHLPSSSYLLFEPQEPHMIGMEKLKEKYGNVEYITAAAGNRKGEIFFDNGDLLGGLVSETSFEKNCIKVPITTIDIEVSKRGLEPPFLIKLDTHGYEIPILERAKQTIKQAELIIIETYNFKLSGNSLKYYEMCSYMEKLGFSSIEIVDLMSRKLDSSFWQMDTFFIPSSRIEFKNNAYQ
jgi:FkbM family methyltransferase